MIDFRLLQLPFCALVLSLCVGAESPAGPADSRFPQPAAAARQLNINLARVFPAPDARNVCPDTPLRLTFPSTATMGMSGKIRIHEAADQHIVETIDVTSAPATKTIGDATYQYYPILAAGSHITIFPRPGALSYGQTYYITIDTGAFVDGREKYGPVDHPNAWRFSTKASPPAAGADMLIIAADGTGDFCTVQAAVDFVPVENAKHVTLELQRGEYVEMVNITRGKRHVTLRGADRRESIISYVNNARFNPRMRSVVDVYADDFSLENLTIRNTTPKGGSQAEALRVRADRTVINHCDFSSLQDTLQLTGRVYVNDCFVEGDVDFVWGSGTVYFNRCELKALNKGYLVQSRNGAERLGYIFADCRLTATPNVANYILARIEPLRFPYSHVAFLNCAMGPHVAPVGWQFDRVPGSPEIGATNRIQFQEFQSTDLDGKPIAVGQRIAPSKQLTADEAAKLRDVARVLGGADNWNPTLQTSRR